MRGRLIAGLLVVCSALGAIPFAFSDTTLPEREADPAKLDQIRAGAPIPKGAWGITTTADTKCVSSGVACTFPATSCATVGIGAACAACAGPINRTCVAPSATGYGWCAQWSFTCCISTATCATTASGPLCVGPAATSASGTKTDCQ